jgi:FixJ family two-component response regulator
MSDQSARIFIIDDDSSVRTSLARLLGAAGFATEVFACADDYLARKRFDGVACLILDVRMPGSSGFELQDTLNELGSDLPILFLTGHGDIPMSVKAIRGGAVNFLTKPVSEEVLLSAVEQALSQYRQNREDHDSIEKVRASLATLTSREHEVMRYVLSGVRNRQIAIHLGITEKTVKAHRAKIMGKLGVSSAVELGRVCARLDIKPKSITTDQSSIGL